MTAVECFKIKSGGARFHRHGAVIDINDQALVGDVFDDFFFEEILAVRHVAVALGAEPGFGAALHEEGSFQVGGKSGNDTKVIPGFPYLV